MYQTTISQSVSCEGVGVHNGLPSRITLRPARSGAGIVFFRTDVAGKNPRVVAHVDNVSETTLGTTLRNSDDVEVAVVEHLLAACMGMGVDNMIVEINGGEVPIMDGSSSDFCSMLLAAGVKNQKALRRRIRILDEISVGSGTRNVRLKPSINDFLTIRAEIDFANSVIGVQRMEVQLTSETFIRELAYARTFGFASDVSALQAKGFARGASEENAIVVDDTGVANVGGLRGNDEFVRHKILDAVGDLALAGAPIAGIYEAEQPGHALNTELVRELIANESAWCWETAQHQRPRLDYRVAATA